MTAAESPRLTGGVLASIAFHAAIVASFFVFRASRPPAGPPMAQLHLIAAAEGPRQLGVAQETPPVAPPPPEPPAATKAAPVAKPKAPSPAPKTKVKPIPKPQPTSALPTAPSQAKPATPAPTAGSGTTGGKGSDINNVDTGGLDFPYPDYLRHIANLVLSRFTSQNRQDLVAEVSFIIQRDGTVDPNSIKLVTPAKIYSFNQQAMGAVEAASTNKAFGALPPGYREDILPVTLPFHPITRSMIRVSKTLYVSALAALMAIASTRAFAQDTTLRGVKINGEYDPLRDKTSIAVLPIAGQFGDSIRAILQRDLDFSDRFTVIPVDSGDPSSFKAIDGAGLNYQLFSQLSVQRIVQVTLVATGLHVALHDVSHSTVANVEEIALPSTGLNREWRLAVHRASDRIVQWITGSPGIAATRVVFVRGQSIHMIDSDGADDIAVPVEANAFSPAWSPNASTIAYTTYGADSRLWLLDLNTGRSHALLPQMRNVSYSTPVFSPDGSRVVYTRSGEEQSDLYTASVSGSEPPHRLTAIRGAVSSQPTFSPDGRRIVFVTNVLGHPELYIMDADGTNPVALTEYDLSDKSYRSDPDWSPDGRRIAYQERQPNDRYQLRTIQPTGSAPKLLTSEGQNESPSWSPDGRHLVFTSSRTGVQQLWVLDVESSRLRQLTKAAGSRIAAWSPRLAGQ